METHWFYVPDICSDEVMLSQEESHHCSRVLRLAEGTAVKLSDGRGKLCDALIAENGKKFTRVTINSIRSFPPAFNGEIAIAVAPTKNIARFEWFVEKAVEIGISNIIPLICENSERNNLRTDRLEKLIISAAKQSHQVWFPKIHLPTLFHEIVQSSFYQTRLIAWCSDNNTSGIADFYKPGSNALVLIGPEGDFSHEEIVTAMNNRFHSISLGNTRLRTETAALVACTQIQFLNTFTI